MFCSHFIFALFALFVRHPGRNHWCVKAMYLPLLWDLEISKDFGTKRRVFLNHPTFFLLWIFPTTFPQMSLVILISMKISCWTRSNWCPYIAKKIFFYLQLKTWNLLHNNGCGTLLAWNSQLVNLYLFSILMLPWILIGMVVRWCYIFVTHGKKCSLCGKFRNLYIPWTSNFGTSLIFPSDHLDH